MVEVSPMQKLPSDDVFGMWSLTDELRNDSKESAAGKHCQKDSSTGNINPYHYHFTLIDKRKWFSKGLNMGFPNPPSLVKTDFFFF